MLIPADKLGVIEVTGADSLTFLQGQATPDLRPMGHDDVVFGAFCTPKGRVICSAWFQRHQDGFRIVLPIEMAESLCKRLSLYVLRSKVQLINKSEAAPLWLSYTSSSETLDNDTAGRSQIDRDDPDCWVVAHSNHLKIMSGVSPDAQQSPIIRHENAFWLVMSREGIPLIGMKESEEHLPQTLALERWGGLSFTKGCYTGQEIVTRTQFLGRVKRALYQLSSDTLQMLEPGCDIYADDKSEELLGTTLCAASLPNGGVTGLAVLKENEETLTIGFIKGQQITLNRCA